MLDSLISFLKKRKNSSGFMVNVLFLIMIITNKIYIIGMRLYRFTMIYSFLRSIWKKKEIECNNINRADVPSIWTKLLHDLASYHYLGAAATEVWADLHFSQSNDFTLHLNKLGFKRYKNCWDSPLTECRNLKDPVFLLMMVFCHFCVP